MASISFDFLSTGSAALARDFSSVGDSSALASRGVKVLQDVIDKLGQRENRTAAESKLLASALRQTGDAADRVTARAVVADAAIRRLSDGMKEAEKNSGGLGKAIGVLGAAADAAAGKGNKFKLALAGLNLASGVGAPVLAGLVVAAGGLASGLAAAGAGLGVFGLVAKSVYSATSAAAQKVQTAQIAYNAAIAAGVKPATAYRAEQIAIAKAYAQLSPAQIQLSKQIGDAQNAWQSFVQSNTSGVAKVMTQGIGLLPKVFAAMQPFLAPAEKALSGIIAKLSTGLSSSGFKSFIDAFAQNSGPAITKIAAAIGNVAVGIGGILRAFLPTSQQMLSGIDKITAKFREWGTTLSGSAGFASLMKTFRTETPQAMEILKNLGTVLVNVGKAMFGLSTFSNSRVLLGALLPLSGVLASLSRNTDLVRVALYGLAAVKIGQQFTWIPGAWAGIVKFAAATEGATIAQTIAAAATRAWGLAMDALPWVALAAAVIAAALLIIKYHTQIWHFMIMVWNDILHIISGVWGWIQRNWPLLLGIITGPVGLAIAWIVTHFGTVTTAVKTVLNAISVAWNAVWNALKAAFRVFVVDGVLGPLGWIITGAARAFGWVPGLGGKLKAAAKAFDAFKNDVNTALGGINGRTVAVSVAMTSSTNPYPGGISGRKAAGGKITGPGGPRSDTAGLFALSDGEWVIRADSAARYGLAAMDAVNRGTAVIRYASGGPVGVNVQTTAPSYKTVEASLLASVMTLAQAFAKAAAAVSGGIGNYKPGAGVQQWRGVVRQALGLAGANVAQLTDPVLYQMQTESGGNPTIVNRTDSNWLAGHPSVGLMQVIAGTFAQYAGRFRNTGPFEYGVSVNPLANVYAAIRYAQAAYGPGLRNAYGGIGTGHGYDRGGWLMPGVTLAVNNTGRPEQVIPGDGLAGLAAELRALREEVRQLTRVAAAIPASTGQHVGGAINGAARDAGFRNRYPQSGW